MKIDNLSVVIPTYNSEGSIESLIIELNTQLNNLNIEVFEIIVVNDYSTDRTLDILNSANKTDLNLKIINNHKNLGQAQSTLIGIENSNFEVIITIDDDFQHPPEEIGSLINTLLEGDYDFVIGYWTGDETLLRNITSYIARLAFNLFSFRSIKHRDTAFRAIKKRIKDDAIKVLKNKTLLDFKKVTKNYGYIKVTHNAKPLNRDFMSFKARSKLATKYIIKDTYFKYIFSFFLIIYFLYYLMSLI